jgi:peptidoglycan-associated lipoprotein
MAVCRIVGSVPEEPFTRKENSIMIIRRAVLTAVAAVMLVLAASCPKAVPPPAVPPAPNPAALAKPNINFFSADPPTVASGQSASLRWSVANATNVQIDNGIGAVKPDDSLAVHPTDTTTYKMEATNSVGTTEALLTVTISRPPAPAEASPSPSSEARAEVLASQLQDIHFSYDKDEIPPEEQSVLDSDAMVLKNLFGTDPSILVMIEGHCDERGSAEYNIALGDRRASFIKDTLIRQGIPGDKLSTISYGKERPACLDLTEDCFSRNRRAHFSLPK